MTRWGPALASFLAAVGVLAAAWMVALGPSTASLGVLAGQAPYMVLLIAAVGLVCGQDARRLEARVLQAAAVSAIAVVVVLDLGFLRYFKAPFWALYSDLPVSLWTTTPSALSAYLRGYLSSDLMITAVIAVLATGAITRKARIKAMAWPAASVVASSVFLFGGFAPMDPTAVTSELGRALMAKVPSPVALQATDRSSAATAERSPLFEPGTIILAIVESAGRGIASSDGHTPLHDRLVAVSGTGGWIGFNNAVAPSNATDVSIPAIVTGTGAHERVAKLQAMPFISDLARLRGYRTAFVTSSTLRWAHFDRFFAGAQLDVTMSAETFGLPFINDQTVDDAVAFRAAANLLEQQSGKLLLMLYTNSLHWPFQQTSIAPIPGGLTERRARAAHIQETGFRELFDALRRGGRLDNALVIVVGDHGEFDFRRGAPQPLMRLETFESGILSPLFLVRMPQNVPLPMAEAIQGNEHRLVSGIDIAPSIADLLGLKLREGLAYEGFSLFRPVPADRIAIASSIGEWRSWRRAALAVARGRDRMTCRTEDLCQLSVDDGRGLIPMRKAEPHDHLFRAALADPVTRSVLGKIHRDHARRP